MLQVRIEGAVEKISEEEAVSFFYARPVEQQVGIHVCDQKTVISDNDYDGLVATAMALTDRYGGGGDGGGQVPRPGSDGGYRVVPRVVEFYEGTQGPIRNERVRFRRRQEGEETDGINSRDGAGGWVLERLAP